MMLEWWKSEEVLKSKIRYILVCTFGVCPLKGFVVVVIIILVVYFRVCFDAIHFIT